jgi:hypothetical protein
MGFLSDVRKLEFFEILTYSLILAASACPGYLVILRFSPQLFLQLGFLNLLFLAVSLTLPLLLANLFLIGIVFYDRESDDAMTVLGVAALACAASLYAGLLVSYLFSLSFRSFMAVAAVTNVVLIVVLNLSGHLERPKRRTDTKGKG